jgi:hypothetical protein
MNKGFLLSLSTISETIANETGVPEPAKKEDPVEL